MTFYAWYLFGVWSLYVARTKALQPGVCLLPVTHPDQLFQGAPGGSQQLLGEVTANGYENCIVQCCNNTEGLCNVVLYKVDIEEVQSTPNCRLYRCEPVVSCSFYTIEGLEVFADVESVPEGGVDGAGNITAEAADEATEPAAPEVYNTTLSPNVGVEKSADNSTDTEGASVQNVTGTTEKPASQTPPVTNVIQPSDTFIKTEVGLVPEGYATSSQTLTASTADWQTDVNRTDSTASSGAQTSPHTDPQWPAGGDISTSRTEERTGSTWEQLSPLITTGPNPGVTTNQPQSAQTSPSDDFAEGTNWQEAVDQGTRVTSFSVLVTSLVVGCLFFLAAVVLIVKRCHDGWKKRHYSRVEYLVEGMYEE